MPYSLKTFIALFFFLFLFNNSYAQSILWAKRAGGNGAEIVNSIATDNFGNVYILGSFDSPNMEYGNNVSLINSDNKQEVFLSKYNNDGILIWTQKIGYLDDDLGNSLCVDASGNIIVTGTFNFPNLTVGIHTINNSGLTDIFVAKFDSNGNAIWLKAIGSNQYENSTFITTDSSDNIILCGEFNSVSLPIGNSTLTNQGGMDIFITKIGTDGSDIWAKAYGGGLNENYPTAKTTLNNDIVISAGFKSPSISIENTILFNEGLSDVLIVKLNSTGNLIWAKQEGTPNNEFASQVTTDLNGNIYQLMNFDASSMTIGNNSVTNNGYFDILLSKYESNGNVAWAKSFGGASYDYPESIICDALGNIILSSIFNSQSIDLGNSYFFNNSGGLDVLIMKLNDSGNTIWAEKIGGIEDESMPHVTLDSFGNLFVTGSFETQSLGFGEFNLYNAGNWDVFLAKIDAASITNTNEININEFSIFPNPATNEITIQTNSNLLNEPFDIIDNIGRIVYSGTIQSTTTTINMELLESGYYSVIVGGNECEKLIIN